MAVSTSSSLTYSRRCMAACASDMRMMDSRWRTAIGIPWLTADSRRSSVYTCQGPCSGRSCLCISFEIKNQNCLKISGA